MLLFGLPDPEHDGATILQTSGNITPTTQRHIRQIYNFSNTKLRTPNLGIRIKRVAKPVLPHVNPSTDERIIMKYFDKFQFW